MCMSKRGKEVVVMVVEVAEARALPNVEIDGRAVTVHVPDSSQPLPCGCKVERRALCKALVCQEAVYAHLCD